MFGRDRNDRKLRQPAFFTPARLVCFDYVVQSAGGHKRHLNLADNLIPGDGIQEVHAVEWPARGRKRHLAKISLSPSYGLVMTPTHLAPLPYLPVLFYPFTVSATEAGLRVKYILRLDGFVSYIRGGVDGTAYEWARDIPYHDAFPHNGNIWEYWLSQRSR